MLGNLFVGSVAPSDEQGLKQYLLQIKSKQYVLAIGGILILFILSRVYAIGQLPPFVDEAIHVNYAKVTLEGDITAGLWDARWLPMKIMALFALLPGDDLTVIRLASVFIGILNLFLIIVLGAMLHSPQVGIIASSIYTILPYAFIFDRMALTDNYLTAAGCVVAVLAILVARSPKRLYAALLALAVVTAMLTKLTGVVFLAIPPAAVLLLAPRSTWKAGIIRIAPAIIIALLLLAFLAWRDLGFWQFTTKSATDISRIDLILTNMQRVTRWFWELFTPPLLLIGLGGTLWLLVVKRIRAVWFVLALLGIAVGPYIVGASVLDPRYMHFASVPVALLIAMMFAQWLHADAENRRRWHAALYAGAALLLLIWPVSINAAIATNPVEARWPAELDDSFIWGGTSGYGLIETADYLQTLVAAEPDGINVLRLLYWDIPYMGLDIYLNPSASIYTGILDPTQPDFEATFVSTIGERPSYFVLNGAHDDELGLTEVVLRAGNAVQIWEHRRPFDHIGLSVWRLSAE